VARREDFILNQSTDVVEAIAIGSILYKPDVIVNIADILKPHMFESKLTGNIYHAMLELFQNKVKFSEDIILAHLLENKLWDAFTPQEHIYSYKKLAKSSIDAKFYAEEVKKRFIKRSVITSCQEIIDQKDSLTSEKLLDEFNNTVLKINNLEVESNKIQKIEINKEDFFTDLFNKFDKTNHEITGLETGFSRIDFALNGLQKGQLINLTGDSGAGKSLISLQWALNICERYPDKSVLYHSLEMSTEELRQRALSILSGIDSEHIENPRLYFLERDLIHNDKIDENAKKEYCDRLNKALMRLNKMNLLIDDTAGADLIDVIIKSKRCQMQNNNLALVVIDHTDILEYADAKGNDFLRIKNIYKGLKKLAKDLNICVLALHQFSNSIQDNTDYRPNIFSLKGASDIRQNCDVVLLIYRAAIYDDLILERADFKDIFDITFSKIRGRKKREPVDLLFLGNRVDEK